MALLVGDWGVTPVAGLPEEEVDVPQAFTISMTSANKTVVANQIFFASFAITQFSLCVSNILSLCDENALWLPDHDVLSSYKSLQFFQLFVHDALTSIYHETGCYKSTVG